MQPMSPSPRLDASWIQWRVQIRYLFNNKTIGISIAHFEQIDRVIFVVWSDKDKEVYEDLIPEYFPPEEEPAEQKEEA